MEHIPEFLITLQGWEYFWLFLSSIGTVVLAGLLGRQLWLQNRTTKLAYMPSIIPRQTQNNNNFTIKLVQNVGNGTAKFVTVKVTNLSNNQTTSVTVLGMIPTETANFPPDKRIEGQIGDEILVEATFTDVDNKPHKHKNKIKISKIYLSP